MPRMSSTGVNTILDNTLTSQRGMVSMEVKELGHSHFHPKDGNGEYDGLLNRVP